MIQKNLNVRQTEELVKSEEFKNKNNENDIINKINEKDPNIADYEKYLSLKLGLKFR